MKKNILSCFSIACALFSCSCGIEKEQKTVLVDPDGNESTYQILENGPRHIVLPTEENLGYLIGTKTNVAFDQLENMGGKFLFMRSEISDGYTGEIGVSFAVSNSGHEIRLVFDGGSCKEVNLTGQPKHGELESHEPTDNSSNQ